MERQRVHDLAAARQRQGHLLARRTVSARDVDELVDLHHRIRDLTTTPPRQETDA